MIEPLHKAHDHYEKLRLEDENVRRDVDLNDSGTAMSLIGYKDKRLSFKEIAAVQEASRQISKEIREMLQGKTENQVKIELLKGHLKIPVNSGNVTIEINCAQ